MSPSPMTLSSFRGKLLEKTVAHGPNDGMTVKCWPLWLEVHKGYTLVDDSQIKENDELKTVTNT